MMLKLESLQNLCSQGENYTNYWGLPTIFSSLEFCVSMMTVIWSGGDVVMSNKYSGMEGSEGGRSGQEMEPKITTQRGE